MVETGTKMDGNASVDGEKKILQKCSYNETN
jgi:hypothetical protein